MSETKIKPPTRVEKVLHALYENGPMSIRGLHELIEDRKCNIRQIFKAVHSLKKAGLVIPRFNGLPAKVGNFYQLSFRSDHKPVLAALLKVPQKDIETPSINSSELLHSEECAIWAKRFGQMWPEARVVRDHRFWHDQECKDTLLYYDERFDVRPDIMLLLPKSNNQHSVRIGVEIERSIKNSKRWMEKLNKLAAGTLLDGVIYICSSDGIRESIRRIYQNNVMKSALRIAHYGPRFLMFSSSCWYTSGSGLKMVDQELRQTNFETWKQFLVRNENNSSRTEKWWIGAEDYLDKSKAEN